MREIKYSGQIKKYNFCDDMAAVTEIFVFTKKMSFLGNWIFVNRRRSFEINCFIHRLSNEHENTLTK